ncbi:hypothetical protein [Halorubrum lipolyticum]|uniref:hypothetical protein n=1 Tax=Halorubrum lipolyticum TaxID=368624 RepID=UPI0011CC2C48|nr:hypothetical protein [Halorubrum lipolyticum]
MSGLHLERPRLNIYGKSIVGCVVAGVVTALVGVPSSVSVGFSGLAVGIMTVAMRRSARTKEEQQSGDDDSKTSDTEKKAKAMVGGSGGGGGGGAG